VLALCAVGGAVGARRLRLPAAMVMGPMILSAIAHLAGLTDAAPPSLVVAVAQVVIGTAVGCRFVGTPLRFIGHVFGHAVITASVMLVVTVATANLLAHSLDMPLAALLLAFAPGGLAEMSLVALALQVDAAFVATHHIARIVLVTTLAPLIFRTAIRD
jgi:membrane AbrB-like protein